MKITNLKMKTAVALVLATSLTAANAALPTGAQDAIDSVLLSVKDFIDGVWPIVTAVIVGIISIKFFKKFVSSAT